MGIDDQEKKKKFSEILFALAGNFGDTLDPYTMRSWKIMFEEDGISMEQIQRASVKIMRSRKISKMPTYAEFLEFIQGSSLENAEQQADIVLKCVRYYGSMKDPEFEDPITAHLMTFRWPYRHWIKSFKISETVWWRKEFVAAYQSYAKSPGRIPASHQIDIKEHVQSLIDNIGDDE